ncbi:MAG: ABC transporter substrate-binding protein [Rhizobiales bacterium]|nr:ABC transporter substrate-binding protein [Hyphomicrobiales bacterium]
MKHTRRAFVVGATAFAAGGLARPAIVQAAEPLTIAYVPANAIHWLCDVLIEKPFLKEAGFVPQRGTMRSSTESIQQIVTGDVQFGSTQPEPLISAVQHGAKDVAAMTAPMNRPAWALNVTGDIKSPKDLKGKVIGVSALKNSEVWLTTRFLEQHGLKASDVDFIVVGTSPAKFSALTKGSIAGAVLFQPLATVAARQGLPVLANLGAIQEYSPTVYAVSKKWAAKNDSGKRLSGALRRAYTWMWDPKNRDESIAILEKYTKKEKSILVPIYEEYFVTDKIYSHGEISLAGFDEVLSAMAKEGDIKSPPPPASTFMLDPSLGGLATST